MADYRVTCHRPDNADLDRRIQGLGGPDWYDTIDNIIAHIQNNRHRFWVTVNGVSVWVIVKQHPTSYRYYLTTEADGYPPNNLLRLPHCP